MRLYFAKDPKGNFGDDLNEILWSRLIPNTLNDDPDHLFIGIGTILNDRIPSSPRKTVFGAGFGYGNPPRLTEGTWDFRVVRGPITAQALQLPPTAAVTDPGILVRRIFPNGTNQRRHGVSFMPHHVTDQNADWPTLCSEAGLNYISPRAPIEDIAAAISRSDRLLTEAMHGAIAADAFRVPWKALSIFDGFNEEKWSDWCRSMEMECHPVQIQHVWALNRLQPPVGRVKQLLKRAIRGTPVWRSHWSQPFHPDSDTATRRIAIQQLRAAAADGGFITSQSSVLEDRLDELECRLEDLRQTYSTTA